MGNRKTERVIIIGAFIVTLMLAAVAIVAVIRNNAQDITHDTAISNIATPDIATPNIATPDTATPDIATPDTATPDTATPDTTVSETETSLFEEQTEWAYPQDVIDAFEEKIGYQPQAMVTEVDGKHVLRVSFQNEDKAIEWPSYDSAFVGWRCEKTLFMEEFERLFKSIRDAFFPGLEPERENGTTIPCVYPEHVIACLAGLHGYEPEYDIGYNNQNQYVLVVRFKGSESGLSWPDTDSSDCDGWRISLEEFEATFNAIAETILANLGGELMYVEDVLDAFEEKCGYRPEYTIEYVEEWNKNVLRLDGVNFSIISAYFGEDAVWCESKLVFESSFELLLEKLSPET